MAGAKKSRDRSQNIEARTFGRKTRDRNMAIAAKERSAPQWPGKSRKAVKTCCKVLQTVASKHPYGGRDASHRKPEEPQIEHG